MPLLRLREPVTCMMLKWAVLVLGPMLAMLSSPFRSCTSAVPPASSLNWPPNTDSVSTPDWSMKRSMMR